MAAENGAPSVDLLSYIFENATDDQDKPVLIDASDPSRFLTARTARSTVRKLIAGLRAEGFEKGDCFCVHSFNDIYYPLIYLAIIGAGGIFTGSNPGYTSLELNHHVRTSHAKYIISEPHILPTAIATAQECGISDSRLFVFNSFDKTAFDSHRPWTDLLQHGEADWVQFEEPNERDTVAMLGFTSGTTGLPKAAMITHNYAVSQIWAIESRGKPYDVSRLLCLPAFHAFALPLIIGCPLRERHSMYLMRRFDLKQYLILIEQFAITETAMVPAMIYGILKSPLATQEGLKSLRYMWCAGSPLRKSTQQELQSRLSSDAKISQVWGLTEVGWATSLFYPEGDHSGSVGSPIPGLTVRIIDEHGVSIEEDNVEGEMLLKGPAMMLGYLDNPEATAEMINEDGWLRTGDIGYAEKGKYYVIDRKKDLIKVRGWQVAPAEIEAVLLTHPQIIGAAVLGVPDAQGTGELPRAFIIRKPKIYNAAATSYGIGGDDDQHEVNEDEIKAFVAERLARYKYLDGGIQFVKEIPRNASGKVLKPRLRALCNSANIPNRPIEPKVNGIFNGTVREGPDGVTVSGTLQGIVTEAGDKTFDGSVKILEGKINGVCSSQEVKNSRTFDEVTASNHLEASQTAFDTSPMEGQGYEGVDERGGSYDDNGTNDDFTKFVGDAIENMKQSIMENISLSQKNSIPGEKRKCPEVMTRGAKRQSLDMTAR